MNRSTLYRTLIGPGVLGIMLIGGCATAQESAQETEQGRPECPLEIDESISAEVNIAYQPIPNGDLIVRDEEWLETCMPNATIEWNQFASGAEVVQAFGSGTIDLGLVGSSPVATLISPPLNIDAQVTWIHDLIGEAESLVAHGTVSEIADLAGGTIAVPYGSTAHLSLLNALSSAELSPDEDVELINLSPDAMLGAWERREIDAAWVWHPTLEVLLEDGTIIMSSEDTAQTGTATYDLAAATTDFLTSNPEFMQMWTHLQDLAVQQINTDPERAAESIGAQLGISPQDAATQMEGYVYLTGAEQAGQDFFGAGLGTDLTATAEFLLEQQVIPNMASIERYQDAVYIEAIMRVDE